MVAYKNVLKPNQFYFHRSQIEKSGKVMHFLEIRLTEGLLGDIFVT
jgi:hypothetical protein